MDSLYVNIMDSGVVTSTVNFMKFFLEMIWIIGASFVIVATILLTIVAGLYCGWYIADTIIKVNRRNS